MGTVVNLILAYQYSGKSNIVTKRGYQYSYFYVYFSFLFGVSNPIVIGDNRLWTKHKTQNKTG
jgi:hypothetical protein